MAVISCGPKGLAAWAARGGAFCSTRRTSDTYIYRRAIVVYRGKPSPSGSCRAGESGFELRRSRIWFTAVNQAGIAGCPSGLDASVYRGKQWLAVAGVLRVACKA